MLASLGCYFCCFQLESLLDRCHSRSEIYVGFVKRWGDAYVLGYKSIHSGFLSLMVC